MNTKPLYSLVCLLLFSLYSFAQKIDTLSLQSPSDFYYTPGETFLLYLTDLDSLEISFDPEDYHLFKYDSMNKVISFSPSLTDKEEHLFYVTKQKDTINIIGFYPINKLETRNGFGRYNTSKILDESSYATITIDSLAAGWILKMNGRKITFENKKDNLFYNYVYKPGDVDSRFKRVEIGADTLIIKDRIYFPFAKMLVNVKVLIIDYSGNLPVIDITPLTNTRKINLQYNLKGEDGKSADTLFVFFDKLINNSNAQILFAACGGNGQNPPPGKNGIDYPPVKLATKNLIARRRGYDQYCPSSRQMVAVVNETDPRGKGLIRIDWHHTIKARGGSGYHGTDWESVCIYDSSQNNYASVFTAKNIKRAMPTPGGKPGEPGKGGIIISNHLINAVASVIGGKSGVPDTLRYSGKISGPKNPWMLSIKSGVSYGRVSPTTYTFSPLNYPADSVLRPQLPISANGKAGEIVTSADFKKWMNIDYIKYVVDNANDLFRFGQVESARNTFSYYKEHFFDDSIVRMQFSKNIMFWELEGVVNTALIKMAANLDYYGNPYGFVPGLGIVANSAAYKGSIKELANAYAACIYLEKQIFTDQNAYNTAVQRLNTYLEENLNFEEEFQDIELNHMPLVERKIDTTLLFLTSVSARINELDAEFKKKAKRKIERDEKRKKDKQFIRNLCTIAKVVPYGQPALGVGVSVFEAVAAGEEGSTFLEGLSSVISDYKMIQSTSKQFSAFKEAVNYSLTSSPPELPIYKKLYNNRDTLLKTADPYFSSVEKVLKELDFKKVSKESVAAEVERMKASHPEYKDLIDSVQKLTELNKDLLEGLLSLQLRLRNITKTIAYNGQLMDDVKVKLSSRVLPGEERKKILSILKNEIVDKLNYYQYFYAKAYEYFTLKQYPGYERTFFNFKGNKFETYDNYQELVERVSNIYLLDASEAARESFTTLNANSTSPSVTTSKIFSLKKDDVEKLNRKEQVSINLFRDFEYNFLKKELSDNEDILIENIEVTPFYNPASVNQFVSGSYAWSKIETAHLGMSRRYKDGMQYDFINASGSNALMNKWTVDINFQPYVLTRRKLHGTYVELINVLTERSIPENSIRTVVSFDSDLKINKEDHQEGGKQVLLDSVNVRVDVVLIPRDKFYGVYLYDSINEGRRPPLRLIAGNKIYDGEKVLYKSFAKNEIVRVTVPQYWNDKKFAYWVVDDKIVVAKNSFDIKLEKKIYRVIPIYN